MSLNIWLRPGERVVVNGAVLRAAGRSKIAIENRAAVLRGSEIMTREDATTPARRLYFACMMAYIDEDRRDRHLSDILVALREILAADPCVEAKMACASFAALAATGSFYLALSDCRKLVALEPDGDAAVRETATMP